MKLKKTFCCLMITILSMQMLFCNAINMPSAQQIIDRDALNTEEAELLSTTTIRNAGDDSGRWPGEAGANTIQETGDGSLVPLSQSR